MCKFRLRFNLELRLCKMCDKIMSLFLNLMQNIKTSCKTLVTHDRKKALRCIGLHLLRLVESMRDNYVGVIWFINLVFHQFRDKQI